MGSLSKCGVGIAVFALAVGVFWQLISTNITYLLLVDDILDYMQQGDVYNAKDAALNGHFKPVSEELSRVAMKVVLGELPSDLEGIYLKVGPNPIPNHSLKKRIHLFDGHGMIHSIRIKGGEATYSNQWVRTESFLLDMKYERRVPLWLGEIFGIIGIIKAILIAPLKIKLLNIDPLRNGVANTAIYAFDGKVLVGHEASLPFAIQLADNGTFTSLGFDSFNGFLKSPVTAHPKIMNDKFYFTGYTPDPALPPFSFGSYSSKTHNLTSFFEIPVKSPPFAHDFSITHKHALIIDNSVRFGVENILSGNFFKILNDYPLRIGVVSLDDAELNKVKWFTLSLPYALIHTLNAWETDDGNDIYLAAPLGKNFDQSLAAEAYMSIIHLHIPTGISTVTYLNKEYNVEFPRVHPKYVGRFAKYGYAVLQGEDGFSFSGIVKFDLQVGSTQLIKYGNNDTSGEVIPVPKSGSAGEASDGVYLLAFMHGTPSEWRVYDGTSMDSIPIAVLIADGLRVPASFHCEWIEEEFLKKHFLNT